MPRRKPKFVPETAIKPGEVRNPYGRPPGSVNEINRRIKEAFTMILENKLPELEEWLTRAAERDPLKTADLLLRISERFTPSLSRTEITGAEGVAFTPITINLPNIPKIDVANLRSSEITSIGESSPIPLLATPEEEPKMLGEGAATMEFQVPKPVLSENQLRDLREMGIEPPESLSEGARTNGDS